MIEAAGTYVAGILAGAGASFVVWVIGWGVAQIRGIFKQITKV